MPRIYSGPPPAAIWHWPEALTLNFDASNDNDANWVTVQNITGRGVLRSIWISVFGGMIAHVRVTIDGGAATTQQISTGVAGDTMGIVFNHSFAVSCLVEMRLNGVETARFGAISSVE